MSCQLFAQHVCTLQFICDCQYVYLVSCYIFHLYFEAKFATSRCEVSPHQGNNFLLAANFSMFLTLKYSAGPFYSRPPPPLPPPPPGPPLPPLCCSRTATTDTAATVLACTAATGCSSEGLYASLDVSRNLVAPGNSNVDVAQIAHTPWSSSADDIQALNRAINRPKA